MCQTDLFLRDVIVTPSGFGEPVYGPGQFVYMAYWLIALSLVIWRLGRDAWATSGIRKAELNFMLLASSLATVVSVTLGLIMPLTTGSKHLAQYVPLSVVLFDAVIAYGIVKKRIMDVGYIFRQAAAYGLFTSYLVGLYSVVYFASDFLLSTVSAYHTTLAHFVSALAIGFSMAPAHGMMQRAAKHLFINLEVLDIGDAMHQSQSLLTSIGTTDELLERFAEITVKATGTDRVLILMTEDGGFVQRHPMPEEGEGERISSDSPLAQLLKQETSPVTVDSLRRGRKTIMGEQARNQLEELKVTTAVSINTKEKQEGILLLGRRISGKIYSAMEQNALQLLCNQLGVALENAKLYTQAQNSRIYNDILLENLVSGVVAADSNGKVTRFNREAQRITGLAPRQVLGTAIQTLPDPLGEYMAATFSTGRKETEEDTILHLPEDKQVHIRLGTSLFHGRSGEILGCLLVFHDLTALKKLQAQIRRSDRLASMGTLSAGMAHEIKNPLVTIKTFTQLLPERHADEEFRKEFRSLVGSEVKRIDGIVNELLSFSRSSQPKLGEVKLHTVLEDSLHLVEQELNRNNIELLSEFKANEDLVRGDADLLSQAFVNFLLNSVAAMDGGGRMTVKTENILDAPAWSTKQDNGTRSIQITFSDTGSGIEQSDLSRIFDPFFTTKSEGTGLGLSVSHGIIEEHQGNVEVESRPGVGTTFYIRFPVLDKEAAA
jgi:PAS domain S-box-containing protein